MSRALRGWLPYNEEDTKQVVHAEKLDVGIDLLDFCLQSQNGDHIPPPAGAAHLFKLTTMVRLCQVCPTSCQSALGPFQPAASM